jgi:hypothetical protein
VQINADLQDEKAAAERWKADCLTARSEFTTMRKERDSLKRQVDTLSDTNATQVERLAALNTERDDLAERLDKQEAELADLRRDAHYRLPDVCLSLEKIPCKAEVLWSSPGSLQPRPAVTQDQTKESWTALTDVFRWQWQAMTESWTAIDHHVDNVDAGLDVYEAMYACSRTAINQIQQVVEQEVAPYVSSARDCSEPLSEALRGRSSRLGTTARQLP